MEKDRAHCFALSAAFLETLTALLPDIAVNGDRERRLPGNLNLRFPGVAADSLLTALHRQISASTGSACNAGLLEPSYVLRALGLNNDEINSSIRFGFGRQSTIGPGRSTARHRGLCPRFYRSHPASGMSRITLGRLMGPQSGTVTDNFRITSHRDFRVLG